MKLKYAAFTCVAALFTINCFADDQSNSVPKPTAPPAQVKGSSASGQTQTTIIDANGNLEVVPSSQANMPQTPHPTPNPSQNPPNSNSMNGNN